MANTLRIRPSLSFWRFSKSVIKEQTYKYLLILDFEATCERSKKIEPQEIIEFPCLKVNTTNFEIESCFHKYVRPKHSITPFCTELTGITQEMVENERLFQEVFEEFLRWGKDEQLWNKPKESVFVTSGDWDLKIMLPDQCQQLNISIPEQMKEWVNIKKAFAKVMGVFPKKDLSHMMEILGFPMQGRLHSGIDDCKNILTIARELAKKDYVFRPTSKLNL